MLTYGSEYDQIIREYFDISDNYTRKFIVALDEAEKNSLLDSLSSSIYNDIVSKIDEIDFGTIPSSRGDITKVQGFDKTEQCIINIRKLILEYKQNPGIIDVVINAINNVKERRALFIKAFGIKAEFPMVLYNLVVLSIERSVSLMISTCIQYIKDPTTTTPKMALDKVAYTKTMEDVMYQQLVSFNTLCNDGTLDKLINEIFKHPVSEDVEIYDIPDNGQPVPSPNGDANDADDLFGNGEPYQPEAEPTAEPVNPDETEPAPMAAVPADETPAEDFPETHFDANDKPVGDDEELDIELDDEDQAPEVPAEEDTDEVTADTEVEVLPAPIPSEEVPSSTPENDPVPVPTSNDDVSPAKDDDVDYQNIPQVNPTDGSSDDADVAISEIRPDINAKESDDAEVQQEGMGDILSTVGKITNSKPGKILAIAGAIGAGVGLAKLATKGFKVIVGVLRNTIYGFYYTKMKIKDYLEIQADFIEANANELEISTTTELSDEKRNKVVKKQREWAMKLRKWADKFNIDAKETAKETEKAVKDDEKKKKKIGKDDDGDDVLF